jgi:hypothetical protein
VTARNTATHLHAVPTNGLADAILGQLNITHRSAAGDMVALVQIPAESAVSQLIGIASGGGWNRVQADSNLASGTFDGAPTVANSHLGAGQLESLP